MPNTVLIGAQWGDEGKGKIIDVLSENVDVVVRYQGGSNAGHTVKFGTEKYVLHLIPSGILRPGQICMIGNGVVVDPLALLVEIDGLVASGKQVEGRLYVSERAHVVCPYHRALDSGRESTLADGEKIGTTGRGIGPTYCDKVLRTGIRMGDLVGPSRDERLRKGLAEANDALRILGADPIDEQDVLPAMEAAADRLRPYVKDVAGELNGMLSEGKSALFEGAQGTMLDIDFGSYPFVTSSNATVGGACTGTGVAPHKIDQVVGVIKAYTTRVGEGPFPTELHDAVGEELARVGDEFGATTGRPRRCGWFDAVVGRYAAMINGVDAWAITKLDVLDGLDTIRICTAYECDGERYKTVPADAGILARCRPVYEDMPGWKSETSNITRYEDLPAKAQQYVERLCEVTGVKLGILSVGPARESTLRIAL